MIYLCVFVIGVVSRLAFSVASLAVIIGALAVMTGVAGAIHHESIGYVLVRAGTISILVMASYIVPVIIAAHPRALARVRRLAKSIVATLRS